MRNNVKNKKKALFYYCIRCISVLMSLSYYYVYSKLDYTCIVYGCIRVKINRMSAGE